MTQISIIIYESYKTKTKIYVFILWLILLNDLQKPLVLVDPVHDKPFGNRVAHAGYLLTSCQGHLYDAS